MFFGLQVGPRDMFEHLVIRSEWFQCGMGCEEFKDLNWSQIMNGFDGY